MDKISIEEDSGICQRMVLLSGWGGRKELNPFVKNVLPVRDGTVW